MARFKFPSKSSPHQAQSTGEELGASTPVDQSRNGSTMRLLPSTEDSPQHASVSPKTKKRTSPGGPRSSVTPEKRVFNQETRMSEDKRLYTNFRPSPVERAYRPVYSHKQSSMQNIPDIPHSYKNSYSNNPSEPSSPTRSPRKLWSPSKGSSDWTRPPANGPAYEPAELNGSPRPGTPSQQYGGSPKRALPPAPLFAGTKPHSTSSRHPDVEDTAIEIEDDGDDVFGLATGKDRPALEQKTSFASDSTFAEDMGKEGFDLYGPAPEGKQERRGAREAQMTRKEVKLINGELVLECKIPTTLHSFLPHKNSAEFTHMRYTAVTCDPDEFVSRGYKLRQNIGQGRETELLICVTMYNENEVDFTRTMHAIMKNITHFCSRTKSRTWGEEGWEKIVVCIISDGRQKVHPRTLDALAAMGVYQEGIAKNLVNQREVSAHVYEYTTQVSLDPELKFKGRERGIMPCQLIFCLKEKNEKKLNSHRWFFNAFGRALNPNVCILLDVGTKPSPTSLYHLWKAFDQDSNVAGAAGEIRAGKGKAWLGLLNPLVASQNFEYKMSNILDKPTESVFGYITVLPGALSAYRYHALQNDETGHGPLSQYFKGEKLHGRGADVFTANMYLAEDRILCWELVAKRKERWVLKYVKNATGETDVPDTVPEFISQRRRWLNGAFFAAVYSLLHFRQIWATEHSMARKILLHIEFVYQFLNLCFTFFSLANFYLTFYFIAGSLSDPSIDPFGHNVGAVIFTVLRYSCVLLIFMQFILSMGNRPQGAKKMYLFGMVYYSIIMMYTTIAALYIVITQLSGNASPAADDTPSGSTDPASGNKLSIRSDASIPPIAADLPNAPSPLTIGNNVFTNIIVSTLSTIGLYFFMSFVYLDPWHMFTSSAQYFALLPSYICTLQVYAFCNAHDVTWGTKGDNIIRTDLGAAVGGKGNTVEMEMPSEQLDIDSCYDEALRNLRDKLEVAKPPESELQQHEDYYRAVRTYMVLVWMSANAVLAMVVSEVYGGSDVGNNFYLKFVLWSVAVLALFRAIGSTVFRAVGIAKVIAEGNDKWVSMFDDENKWVGPSSSGIFGSSSGGSWISEKLSNLAPSSLGSSVGKE